MRLSSAPSKLARRVRARALRHRWETADPLERGRRHRLAVCAVFKDEAEYLGEWLDFHLAVGVEKFYLYDNNSTDGYRNVLAPYIADGIVTLHHITVWPPQLHVYMGCLRTYRHNADWIAFIDIDEFVYSTEVDSLSDALDEFRQHPAVGIHWLMFNTSGHILRPEGSQLMNFTKCQKGGNRHVRLIVQPERTVRFVDPHMAVYVDGLAVNENGETLDARVRVGTPAPSVDRLRVNHYWTRSAEEWFTRKLARGTVDGVWYLRDADGLLMAERTYGDATDVEIQRFLPLVRR